MVTMTDGETKWRRAVWSRETTGGVRYPVSYEQVVAAKNDLSDLFTIETAPESEACGWPVSPEGFEFVRLTGETRQKALDAYVWAREAEALLTILPYLDYAPGRPPPAPRNRAQKSDYTPIRPTQASAPTGGTGVEGALKNHGVVRLYHFTDRSNLRSISKHGGLYSWKRCAELGIVVAKPGGDELSRSLDSSKGLEDYVRLSFSRETPMLYVTRKDGRVPNPIVLEVDPAVASLEGTLFSDGNATANVVKVGAGLEGLSAVRFDVLKKRRWETQEEKHFKQAEVLVLGHIPARFIRNLPE